MDCTSDWKIDSLSARKQLQPLATAVKRSTVKIRFGPFEFQTGILQLLKHGVRMKLQLKPAQLLEVLITAPGELITRESLRRQLWPPGTFVNFEGSLNTAVNRLRAALNDAPDDPVYIQTVPRLGYRFIHPLTRENSALPPSEAALDRMRDETHVSLSEKRATSGKNARLLLAALGIAAALVGFVAARILPPYPSSQN